MRCSEARRRLTGSRRDDLSVLKDRDLLDHLASCPACAREAEAARLMKAVFEGSATDDSLAMLPQEEQRQLVEARAYDHKNLADRVGAWLSGLHYLWWRRPTRSVSIGLAAAALAVVTFVPFSYDRTLGYDIAFAGVCQEVALDDEKICDMLHSLGLGEAAVDLGECDSVCCLNIICLRSEEEVRLVVSALERMCKTRVTSSVIPLVDRTSSSLLDRANDKVFRGGHGS